MVAPARDRGFVRATGTPRAKTTLAPVPDGATIGSLARDHAELVLDLRERHGRSLHGFARRLGLGDEAAEDAAQEALLRLFRALAEHQAIEDPRRWLFHTLYRIAVDDHRLRRRLASLRERLTLSAPPIVADEPDHAGRISIWAAVDRLPARQRQVLYLRYRADLAFEDIATVLGITPAGARHTAAKAIDRLRLLTSAGEDLR